MFFALICRDKPGALQVRMDARPDHVAYLKGLDEKGQLKAAGPLLDDDGKPCGSLIILDVVDKAEAQAIADNDPYAHADLFADVDVKPYTWIFHPPEA